MEESGEEPSDAQPNKGMKNADVKEERRKEVCYKKLGLSLTVTVTDVNENRQNNPSSNMISKNYNAYRL